MKGNAIVGQSGGPTAVINSSLAGVYESSINRGCERVYGMLHGIQGFLEERITDLSNHIRTNLDVELLKRTPSAYLGSCRYKLPEVDEDPDTYERIFEILEKYKIKYFYYIGGNDSMDTIKKLYDYAFDNKIDILFMGVPKTIDNDLMETDHTPGYGSAAKYIGTVTKEIIRDGNVFDQKQVTILEVMGRNAGWLTGATALAHGEDCEGPDMIYLPEKVFDIDKFISRIENIQKHKKSVVVAVSEGIKIEDGRYVSDLTDDVTYIDAFGHKQLTGTARYLANLIAREVGCKTRAVEFSTLQRSASHTSSRVDVTEAYQVGGAAVKATDEGLSGQMVTLNRISNDPYQCSTGLSDVHKIANMEKKVPLEWIKDDGKGLKDDFIYYVNPLIQAELSPIMVNGLPRHLYYKHGIS